MRRTMAGFRHVTEKFSITAPGGHRACALLRELRSRVSDDDVQPGLLFCPVPPRAQYAKERHQQQAGRAAGWADFWNTIGDVPDAVQWDVSDARVQTGYIGNRINREHG